MCISLAPFKVRNLKQSDFFWLNNIDCFPLAKERDSIYLMFSTHFSNTSFACEDSDGEVLGFLLGFFCSEKKYSYIHYLFVHEEHRNRGIGKRLVTQFEDCKSNENSQGFVLYTARAQEFYRKLGYLPDSTVFEDVISKYILNTKKVQPMAKWN